MMQPPRRRLRLLAALALIAGCAGPVPSTPPSTSPDPSQAAVESSSALPSGTTEPSRIAAPSATTVAEPTYEPEPTLEGQAPPRTGIEIRQDVVDRTGVPASIGDRYWWTGSDVGLLGTTAQLGLPSDESVLDAKDGFVVSEKVRRGGEESARLTVRDFRTGAIVGEAMTTLTSAHALLASGHLFWTGMRGNGCPGGLVDGGIWALDLAPGSEPLAIVEPGQPIECGLTGRRLVLSSSGDTIGAIMASYGEPNWIDVIDVASLTRRTRIHDVWPSALTDSQFIQWDHRPTDGIAAGLGGLSAYGLGVGALKWRFPGAAQVQHFGPSQFHAIGSTFLVEYTWSTGDETDLVLATFDPATGQRRELLRQRYERGGPDPWQIRLSLSSPTHLTLERGWGSERVDHRSLAVLDVATSTLKENAYSIDVPWVCFPEYCWRRS